MDERQFSVSLDGHFLFRTQWDDDWYRLQRTEKELAKRFPKEQGFKILRSTRSKTFTASEIKNWD